MAMTTDGELVERFCRDREPAAFEELVARHGPTVMGVCRRRLNNEQDAEDVFQATFMVLARSAQSIRKRRSISSWLYGVALRTAARHQRDAIRRREREMDAMKDMEHARPDDAGWDELAPVLDEELSHLPEKYRQPIVLCYLEGRTNEEAAEMLGWPSGSMSRRLSKGRELLRRRLVRRGVAGTGAAITALIAQNGAAAVPAAAASSITEAALLVAAGKSVIAAGLSAGAVELSKGVVRMMTWTKIRTVTLSVAVTSLCVSGLTLAVKPNSARDTSAAAVEPRAGTKGPASLEVGDLNLVLNIPDHLTGGGSIPATVTFKNTGKETFALNPIGHGFTFTDKKTGRSYSSAHVQVEGLKETVAYSREALDAAKSNPAVTGHSITTNTGTGEKSLTLNHAIVLQPGVSRKIKLAVEQFQEILPTRPGVDVSRTTIESIPDGTYDIQYQFRSLKPGAKKAQALNWWGTTLSITVERQIGG